jgi:hypothetical protein
VPKGRAARLLGVSPTALQRWIRSGRLPAVRRPRGREEVDAEALLDVLAEVWRLRDEDGAAPRAISRAFRRLAERDLPRPKLRPNQSAPELKSAYLGSTPIERLRETAELSLAGTTIARVGSAPAHMGTTAAEPAHLLRFFELLRALRAHDVEFVVIGGFALGFHGFVRATKDVDIVPNPGEENLTRLWHALEEIDEQPQGLEGFRPEEMPVEWSLGGLIAGNRNWIVHTRHGRVDVMQWVEPFESYDELQANAIEVEVEEVGPAILVAGLEDLMAMKEAAGRDQDRLDVTALRMAHGLEE